MAASKTTTSRGHAISYEDEGSGPPVVLFPGYMQSTADYRDAGYVDRLADRWRVLIVDPLGHGRSAKPHDPEAYREPGVAADVISLLEAEALDKAVLWGYSRGASLAMIAAIELPSA
jgi:pimeloyl-ACP methyl ester carboxylesterase